MSDILHWVLVAIAVPVLVVMIVYTIRRARDLDSRIDKYHEEQEAAANKPGPINPYEHMGELFGGEGIGNREQGTNSTDSRPATHVPGLATHPGPATHALGLATHAPGHAIHDSQPDPQPHHPEPVEGPDEDPAQ